MVYAAAVLDAPGPPEALQVRDLPIPTPQPGQVLIKVEAFGFNRSERGYGRVACSVDDAKKDGSWTILDEPEAGIIPPDLADALSAVEGAAAGFNDIPDRQRKNTLAWIALAKRPETREARIGRTVVAAAEGRSPFLRSRTRSAACGSTRGR